MSFFQSSVNVIATAIGILTLVVMAVMVTVPAMMLLATIAIGVLALVSLVAFAGLFPASIILAFFGVGAFTNDFVLILFLICEAGIFAVFAYTLREECGLPELDRACPLHLALYPIVPLILFVGYDHGSIPAELLMVALAISLVGAFYQALKAREKAQLFFGSRSHHPLFKQRVFRSTIVATGLILLGGLCFVHLQEGIGWLVTRIVLWVMTAVYVLAGFLYRDVWYQEFRSENEADPR